MKILIVDDNQENRCILETLLTGNDYEIVCAADGIEALEKVAAEPFDLIISDILMPRMDGFQLCHEVKTNDRLNHIAFVFYSATYTDPKDEEFGLSLGAERFIVKPQEPEVFVELLKDVIRDCVRERLTPVAPPVEEGVYLKLYNERLIKKLEDKSLELEAANRELKARETHLRTIIESEPECVKLLAADGTVLEMNPAGLAMIEADAPEQMIGRSVYEVVAPEYRPAFQALIESVFRGESGVLEFEVVGLKGTRRFLEMHAVPLRTTSGDITALLGIARDLSERERAETILAERVRLAGLSSDVGIALTQSDTLRGLLQRCAKALVRHLNAAFARVWTLNERENVLELQASAGMYTHLDGPHSRVPVGQFKIGLIAAKRKPHLTNEVIGDPRVHDQEWAKREGMVAFAGYPLLVDDQLVGVMAMFARHELTEFTLKGLASVADEIALGVKRKQTEESLQVQTIYFRQLFESAPVGIALLDPGGRVTEVNESFEAMFQYSVAELKGRFLHEFIVPPDQMEEARAQLSQAQRGGVARLQAVRKRKDGKLLDVVIASHLIVIDENPVGVYTIYVDISEQKQLEEQFRQAQKMEAVGRLAGGVAHDFNNLLTVITGYSEMALAQLDDRDPRRRFIEEVKKAGQRAASLTRQLLAFSRQQVVEPKVLDLNTLVADMGKMVLRLIGEDIELITRLDPALGRIKADPGQIEQVILNLAVNARDAMPHGGTLRIETANRDVDDDTARRTVGLRPGRYVVLAVGDTGCGMDEETQSHIFEPFFTTKEVGKGTGLGLSTVYGIVQQSHGHIEVESELNRGTTFKVYLPWFDEAVESPDVETPPVKLPGGRETILLAEDDEGVRSLAGQSLQSLGYEILEAQSGAEALQTIERHRSPIHLLLTDVVMPQMSGIELAKRVTALLPEIKVLFMSGYTERATVHHDQLDASAAYLQKPFTVEGLAFKVREVLDGSVEVG
jgi:PAS domain S-box-containing protein